MRTRTIRILALVLALAVGCSAPSSTTPSTDAGRELSCGGYVNAIGIAAFRCEWQAWQCETPPPPSSTIDACRARVAALSDPSCEVVREIVEGCR